jgi:hypothetical protein
MVCAVPLSEHSGHKAINPKGLGTESPFDRDDDTKSNWSITKEPFILGLLILLPGRRAPQ